MSIAHQVCTQDRINHYFIRNSLNTTILNDLHYNSFVPGSYISGDMTQPEMNKKSKKVPSQQTLHIIELSSSNFLSEYYNVNIAKQVYFR